MTLFTKTMQPADGSRNTLESLFREMSIETKRLAQTELPHHEEAIAVNKAELSPRRGQQHPDSCVMAGLINPFNS